MTDIEPYLERLGLLQYWDVFIEEGFDTWETLLDIQETDLEALGVKLGHRRKIQRAIAEYRGYASDRPLGSPPHDASSQEISKHESGHSQISSNKENLPAASSEPKRKYRRHPKPDENAPEKPPSAYVLFSNKVRDEVRHENLSFTETARLVGERWQKLDPAQKEPYESHAASLKEAYNTQLAEYKKTDAYREYAQYLADFKAKHGTINESKIEPKRPKLEADHSSGWMSISTIDNTEASSHAYLHARGNSLGSSGSYSRDIQASTGPPGTLQVVTSLPNLNIAGRRRGSPNLQFAHEKHLPEFLSNASSLSEEPIAIRMEHGDPLSHMSLSTPPAGTPPPTTTAAHKLGRTDFIHSSGSQSWQRQGLPSFGGSSTPGDSPTKSFTPQSITNAGEMPRARSQDMGRAPQSTGHPQQRLQAQPPTSLKGSLSISQLVVPNSNFDQNASTNSQRILPLPYASIGSQSQHTGTTFGQLSIPSPSSHFQSTPERFSLPPRYNLAVQNRSDDEAASTLAGLSESRSSSRMQNPRSTR